MQDKLTSLINVPLDDIMVSKLNGRDYYEQAQQDELIQSIRQIGQIYPVVVRRINESKFELLIGSRRLRAARQRQMPTIEARVIDVDDPTGSILALSENLQRVDMTPFEEARMLLHLTGELKIPLKILAKRIGKNEEFIRRRLKLLSLPLSIQEMVCKGSVTVSHVSVIASLSRVRDQKKYARAVAKHRLTDTELISLINAEKGPRGGASSSLRAGNTLIKAPLRVARFQEYIELIVKPLLDTDNPDKKLTEALVKLHETLGRICPKQSSS